MYISILALCSALHIALLVCELWATTNEQGSKQQHSSLLKSGLCVYFLVFQQNTRWVRGLYDDEQNARRT